MLERGELSLYRSTRPAPRPIGDWRVSGTRRTRRMRVRRGGDTGDVQHPERRHRRRHACRRRYSDSAVGFEPRAVRERLWGKRDERWRSQGERAVRAFPTRAAGVSRDGTRASGAPKTRAGTRKGWITALARTASSAELCLRALPHGLGGTLLESAHIARVAVHRLEASRVNEAIERTNAFIEGRAWRGRRGRNAIGYRGNGRRGRAERDAGSARRAAGGGSDGMSSLGRSTSGRSRGGVAGEETGRRRGGDGATGRDYARVEGEDARMEPAARAPGRANCAPRLLPT